MRFHVSEQVSSQDTEGKMELGQEKKTEQMQNKEKKKITIQRYIFDKTLSYMLKKKKKIKCITKVGARKDRFFFK